MLKRMLTASLCGVLALAGSVTLAAEPKATVVAQGLDNPSGLAIHSGGDIFISARDGMHRLTPGNPGKLAVEVSGFKTDIYGKGPMYNIGPLGVACLGDSHIIVGDGSLKDAEELVRVFKVGPKAPAKPQMADAAEHKFGPIGPGESSAKGEGNFYAIAVGAHGAYITSNGDDTKGWVLKLAIEDGKPTELTPFIATKTLVNVDAPVGIALDKDGNIIVGQMGEMNVAGDSLITAYSPEDGKLLWSHKTELNDIAGVAFSPSGKLYVVDFSWVDAKNGGLYRLDVTEDGCKSEKVMSLDKPTALAFDKSGKLYISVFGTSEDGKAAGQVLRIDEKL